ncbi:MAG: hypothetical protein ACRD22_13075, partial [Terriglobia bacterium]
ANGGGVRSFESGFLGAFAAAEIGGEVAPGSRSGEAIAARTALSAVVGGTVSELAGGSFANGAISAAFQELFNHALDAAARRAELQRKLNALEESGKLSSGDTYSTRNKAAVAVLDQVAPLSHEYGYEIGGSLYTDKYGLWHYQLPTVWSSTSSSLDTDWPGYHTHPSGPLLFSNEMDSANGEKINDATWVEHSHQALYLGVELPNGHVGISVCEPGCSLIGVPKYPYGTPGTVIQP